MFFPIVLFTLAFLNVIKVPFQLGNEPEHGHEATPWMLLFAKSWRGSKMQSDPTLFLAIHTILGERQRVVERCAENSYFRYTDEHR